MRVLLIHNDNLPEDLISNNEIKKDIEFYPLPISQASDSLQDYDSFLSQQVDELYSLIDPFEPDLIVFPFSLNEVNPGELTGIRFAIHIRLDGQNRSAKYKPMLFIGPNSIAECLRIDHIASFLLTPGVFTSIANSKDALIDWIEGRQASLAPLSDFDYSRFLSKCEIKPPSNYADNHHSIANVWGATVLSNRVTTESIPNIAVGNDFLNSLFFKYTCASNKIINNAGGNVIEVDAARKKFLLIDDEAPKGWGFALSHYLRMSSKFDIISEKVKRYDDYTEKNKRLIENGEYDIVFLDLRLNGPDEESIQSPSQFSGMSVLKKIKSINPGTQVIMFTASNKAWNLKALLDAGADGYYVKPSPEFFSADYIDNNFQSLSGAIKHCLGRSYLRPLYKRLKSAIHICDNCIISREYADPIKNHLEVSFSLLSKAGNTPEFSYAFLALFGVIEEYVKYFITTDIEGKTFYYFDDLKTHFSHLKASDNKVGNWGIGQGTFFKKDEDAKSGFFSIADKVISIDRDLFKKSLRVADAKMLINLKDLRNDFVHKEERGLSYPSVNTPSLGEHRAYEELFRIVEIILSNCKK